MRSDSKDYPSVRDPASLQASSGIVVRPELVVMSFSVAVVEASPRQGAQLLQGLIQSVRPRLASVGASMRLLDFSCQRLRRKSVGKRKSRGDTPELRSRCVAEGEIRAPLPEDFWERAEHVAELTALARALVREGEAVEPPARVSYQAPVALVAKPEAHREALVSQWVSRAKALAVEAQSASLPLHLRQIEPPGEVQQQPRSLEEVELRLGLSGTLDAAP